MKRLLILFIVLISAALLAGCVGERIPGTDLSGISIDGIRIGTPIKDVDLERYHDTGRYSGNYAYLYDEIILDTKNETVSYLFGRFDEPAIQISVNGISAFNSIDDISALLGDNCREKTYDREQHLLEHIYYDYDHQLTAEFIYSGYDGSLLWGILSAN